MKELLLISLIANSSNNNASLEYCHGCRDIMSRFKIAMHYVTVSFTSTPSRDGGNVDVFS